MKSSLGSAMSAPTSLESKARAALHRDVLAICSETCHFLGLEVTKSASEVIAELLYKKLTVYAGDLEAFAKHAKRTTINAEDVKLLVRRNPSLKSHLNTIAPTSTNNPKDKRRKTASAKSDPPPSTTKPKEISNLNNNTNNSKNIQSDKLTNNEKSEEEKSENACKMVVDEIDLTFD